jgi:hypothetical protein
MLIHEVLLQQHLRPHRQKHQIAIERPLHERSIATVLGRTAEEAAKNVMRNARA